MDWLPREYNPILNMFKEADSCLSTIVPHLEQILLVFAGFTLIIIEPASSAL